LGHSRSPELFARFFEKETSAWSYELFPMPQLDGLREWLDDNPDISGLNVTIPHKQAVIPLLDALDPSAGETGAVNCIRISHRPALHLEGFNTDTTGFATMLDEAGVGQGVKALVFGTGGAALAVHYVLKQRSIPYLRIGRNLSKADLLFDELDAATLSDRKLLIQTTPLGMEGPWAAMKPDIPYESIGAEHICLDLVYRPALTPFMKACAEMGAQTRNGMQMLEAQAAAAWELFSAIEEIR
jgi:shikimate dehydrogenase